MNKKIILILICLLTALILYGQENLVERQLMVSVAYGDKIDEANARSLHEVLLTDLTAKTSASIFDYNGSRGTGFEDLYRVARELGCDIFVHVNLQAQSGFIEGDYYIYDILNEQEVIKEKLDNSDYIFSDLVQKSKRYIQTVSREDLEQLYIDDTVVYKGVTLSLVAAPGTEIKGLPQGPVIVPENGVFKTEVMQNSMYVIEVREAGKPVFFTDFHIGMEDLQITLENAYANEFIALRFSTNYRSLTGLTALYALDPGHFYMGLGVFQSFLLPTPPFFAAESWEAFDKRTIDFRLSMAYSFMDAGSPFRLSLAGDIGTTIWNPKMYKDEPDGGFVFHPTYQYFATLAPRVELKLSEGVYFSAELTPTIFYSDKMNIYFENFHMPGDNYRSAFSDMSIFVKTSDQAGLTFALRDIFFGLSWYL